MRTRRPILVASALSLVLASSCEGTTFRCDPGLSWTTDTPRADAAVPFEPTEPDDDRCTPESCFIREVAAGPENTCVGVGTRGSVICFGANEHGQSSPSSARGGEVPPTWVVRGAPRDGGVSSGSHERDGPVIGGAHACAVVDETLRCWGHPLVTGGARDEVVDVPIAAPGFPRAGALHTCAQAGEGSEPTAYCFGAWDGFDPEGGVAHPPRAVSGIQWVTSAAGFRSCGLDSSHASVCWGGVPPDGTLSPGAWALPPTPPPPALSGAWVVLGPEHACVSEGGTRLLCWGRGDRGQLGDGARTSSDAPVVAVLPERLVQSICAGGAGGVRERADGSLAASPQPGFTCASLLGRVWCWGANDRGQLGDGTTIDRAVPTLVEGLTGVRAVVCGGAHACALTWRQGLQCWGANDHGQLGIPSSELDGTTVPLEIDISPGDE